MQKARFLRRSVDSAGRDGTLRVGAPVQIVAPDDSSTLVPLHVTFDGHAASVKLPPLHTWQVLHVVL